MNNNQILDRLFIGCKVHIRNKDSYIFTVKRFNKKSVVLEHVDIDDQYKITVWVDKKHLSEHIEFINKSEFEK